MIAHLRQTFFHAASPFERKRDEFHPQMDPNGAFETTTQYDRAYLRLITF